MRRAHEGERRSALKEAGADPPAAAGPTAGLAGASAAVVALAALHTLVPRIPFPPSATAQWVVRTMPGSIDTFFIDRLHHLVLPLAEVVAGAGFLAAGALLGLPVSRLARRLGEREPLAWVLLLSPLWGVPVALAPLDASAPPRWAFALATLPAVLLGAGVAARAAGRGWRRRPPPRGVAPEDLSRRQVVTSLVVGAAGLFLGSADLGSRLSAGAQGGGRLELPLLSPATRPPPSASDAAFDRLPGLASTVTPTARFYVVDEAIVDPFVDPATWRLSVGGLVNRPLRLSYSDLARLPALERFQTLECISNPVGGQLISNARWEGIPLVEILGRAGVGAGAVEVVFRSADGYSDSLPIDLAMDERTLVALGMNGAELTRAHGFPARLLSIGTYGMKNPKWLTSIEVVDRPYTGFWEERGWSRQARVKTSTRFDLPRGGSSVARPTTIAGIAFSGDRGISAVEVSVDNGATWNGALLETPFSPYTWVRWLHRWTPARSGTHTLRARAFDGDGVPQTSAWAPPHPDGASGYPVIAVSVGSR